MPIRFLEPNLFTADGDVPDESTTVSDVDMIRGVRRIWPFSCFLLVAYCHDIISDISVAYFLLVTGTALDLWRVAIPMT